MSTDAVLEAIDGALADYGTSADAMRWSPDPELVAPAPPVMIGVRVDAEAFTRQLAAVMDGMAEVGRQVSAMFAGLNQAALTISGPLMKLGADLAHAADVQKRPRWHRRRCPRCNPRGFTSTASPEMRDYRRRLKARARRKRR